MSQNSRGVVIFSLTEDAAGTDRLGDFFEPINRIMGMGYEVYVAAGVTSPEQLGEDSAIVKGIRTCSTDDAARLAGEPNVFVRQLNEAEGLLAELQGT